MVQDPTCEILKHTSLQKKLGLEVSKVLPFFHALKGCVTISSFAGKGKKTAWAAWTAYSESTTALVALTNLPSSQQVKQYIKRLIVLMYDRTSTAALVKEARLVLFSQKGSAFNNIPPTQAALHQHIVQAIFQASYC